MRESGAVALALLIMAGMLLTVLTDSKPRLASTNTRVSISGVALTIAPGEERCQDGEFVPSEASEVKLYVGTFGHPVGEPLVLSIFHSDGVLASRREVGGGYPPGMLEVGIPSPPQDVDPGRFCLQNLGVRPMSFAGNRSPANPEALGGLGQFGTGDLVVDDIRVDYFRPGKESWLELAPDIARRFALFKPTFVGPWTMWGVFAAVFALWAAVILALVAHPRLGLRAPRASTTASPQGGARLRRRRHLGLPLAGWVCAAIAVVNAALWGLVTPAFQIPDEPAHVGYAQYLAETGRLPRIYEMRASGERVFSEEYHNVLDSAHFSLEGKPNWSPRDEKELSARLEDESSRLSERGAANAAGYPPLYYALEALPARIGAGLNPLDRMYAMRLVSALLSGLTVAFVYLFVLELLPGTSWAAFLSSLAVGFQPVFGFLAGGVNNDNLLFAAAAALLFLVARAFRSGLTPRLGVALGGTAAVGVLAKPTMVALLPGAALAIALLIDTAPREQRRLAKGGALAAAATLVGTTFLWFTINSLVFDRPALPVEGLVQEETRRMTSLRGQLSYLWQYFLPRLPFMQDMFPRYPQYPVWDIYIQGFIGRFGYFQYGFPNLVNRVGLGVMAVVAALAGLGLVRRGEAVRGRWAEAISYIVMAVGVILAIGITGYRFRAVAGFSFEQTRYLFPLLGLYGAAIALAARGAGRRWGPAVGAFLVVLAMGHSFFAMLLTIGRYYA